MSDEQRYNFPVAGTLVHRTTSVVDANDSAGFADLPGN